MKRIVLVEDDEDIRHIFQLVFGEEYDLISLETGELIVKHEIRTPDLFILDKQIVGINGLEVCAFIRSNPDYRNVPIIMISASPDIVLLSKKAGANEAIAKPFSLKLLRETVVRYLG